MLICRLYNVINGAALTLEKTCGKGEALIVFSLNSQYFQKFFVVQVF